MTYGCEVWNSSQQKTLSLTDRSLRIVGYYNEIIEGNTTSPLFPVPGMTNDPNQWFPFVLGGGYSVRIILESGGFRIQNVRSELTGCRMYMMRY